MQAETEFRTLGASDYGQMVALWSRCEGAEMAEGDDEASFGASLARNPGLSPCATAGGVLIGASLCGHGGRRGLIYHLAVAPECRGQGIGRELTARGLAGPRRQGVTRATILVASDNSVGQGFWEGQGFEVIGGALPLGLDPLLAPAV